MSYANSKAKYAKEKSFDQEEKHSGKCHAHGCPLPGSVSTGGPFFCSYHSKALPEQWGFITEIIKESKDILLALDEVQKIDVISWASSIAGYPPKWQEFHHLFDHKPDLQPTEEEQKNKGKYEWSTFVFKFSKKIPDYSENHHGGHIEDTIVDAVRSHHTKK